MKGTGGRAERSLQNPFRPCILLSMYLGHSNRAYRVIIEPIRCPKTQTLHIGERVHFRVFNTDRAKIS